MGKQRVATTCVALVICVVAAGCLPDKTDWERTDPAVPAPDFALPQLDAEGEIRLSDLRGDVVIMEFWATWCGPCRFSTPSLDAIYRKYRKRGVSVLLVNQGEDAKTVRDWVEGRFVAPILMDSDRGVGRTYQVSAVPRLLVIDQEGNILYVRSGYNPQAGGLEHNLKLILKELLAEESAPTHG